MAVKINVLSGESYNGGQPHEQFDWLRQSAPVYWYPIGECGGLWLLTRYREVFEVDRDYERFTSTSGTLYPFHYDLRFADLGEDTPGSDGQFYGDDELVTPKPAMLDMDPPEHTGYRKLLNKSLSRRSILDYEPRIRELARQIVDKVVDRGQCDFVADVAGEMAGYVVADLLGLPLEDGRLLYEFTEVFHAPPGYLSTETIKQRMGHECEYIEEVFERKRANPGDDLTSILLTAEVNGEPLSYNDFFAQLILMINGGTDTARNVIATGLLELINHPGQFEWLMQDLTNRMPVAREELLRWISPVVYQCRMARKDTELGGREIKAGQFLALYFGAANRDPEKFERPHELDLSRSENKHLAFGGGHHICIGQWVARAEIDAMLKEVLTRMHNIRILEEPKWLGSEFIYGLSELKIRFDA